VLATAGSTTAAEADIVVVDMDHEEVLSGENTLYRCGWASTEGLKTKGAPVVTIQLGRVLFENGVVSAEAGSGRVLTRRPAQVAEVFLNPLPRPRDPVGSREAGRFSRT
jgi:hypothetical protein